jgi:origin recognition complex subunit 3
MVYFEDKSRMIRKSFRSEPRAVIQSALENPSIYLGCECCSTDQLNPQMCDITILYRLYLECGRLINLQDWYEAFKSILEDENIENEEMQ